MHRRDGQVVHRGVPRRLHLRRGPQALHQPQGMHRLRRLRACLPGRGDQPGPAGGRRGPGIHRGQPHVLHRDPPGPRRAPRCARWFAQDRRDRDRHPDGRPEIGTGLGGRVLDGNVLVDAHVHVPVLGTLRPAWLGWARNFGPQGLLDEVWDTDGVPRPDRLDVLFEEQGVDVALLFCEYSPKVTGIQTFEDLLPLVEHNPRRFRPIANVNPHLHFPIAAEVNRQLDLGGAALKLHPVHGGFRCDDRALYPAYQVLAERNVPLVVHCGTSSFPGAMNELADPALLLPVVRDFPTLNVVLAHGGRGWWYDAAAFMALSNETVWIELSGLPPKRLPEYYARYDLGRLARRWIFATDWPGVPGAAQNARAVAGLGLPDDIVAAVLGGNALAVYAGLHPDGLIEQGEQ